MELYKPFKSKLENKKYSVYVINEKTKNKKLIHFGDTNYQDFTQHKNKQRRENYRTRAKGILLKDGTPAYLNKKPKNTQTKKHTNPNRRKIKQKKIN